MTEEHDEQPPKYTDENKEEVSQELLDEALALMRGAAKGNGLKPESIVFESFEGEVLHFMAHAFFKINPQTGEKLLNGKQRADEIVGSEQEMRNRIQSTIEKIAANKAVKKNTVDLLKKRNDLGFFLDNQAISLESLNKSIGVHEVCTTCSGSAKIQCVLCHGQGNTVCTHCNGTKEKNCTHCMGQQWITGPDGKKTPCQFCSGRGKTACEFCHHTGKTECRTCNGTGKSACQTCAGTGWHSRITYMKIKAHSHFDYDEEDVPEELPEILDTLGPLLVTEEHADVRLEEDSEIKHNKEMKVDAEKKRLKAHYTLPYFVRLPWGDIKFKIKNNEISGKLFGFRPSLLEIPPFLEKTAAPGLRALDEAASKRGNVSLKIQEAMRYRIISETFLLTAQNPLKKTHKILCEKYPFGIRGNALKHMVTQADIALKYATLKPRIMGLTIGLVISTILYAAYYMGPVREALIRDIPDIAVHNILDILLVLLSGTLSMFSIQFFARDALKKAIGKRLPPEKQKKLIPKIGQAALWGYTGSSTTFLLILFFTAKNGSAPLWFETLTGHLF